MAIPLSSSGPQGQTSSSLGDGQWPAPQLSTEERREVTIVITLSFLGLEGKTLFSRS